MKQSNFLSLGWRDAARGFLVAILTPVFFIIQERINQGFFSFDWKELLMAAVGGLLAYLSKNLFTKPDKSVVSADDFIGNRPDERK